MSKTFKKRKRKEKKSNLGKKITKDEAELFIKNYHYPCHTRFLFLATGIQLFRMKTRKTSPNVMMFGGDENYLLLNGFTIAGRPKHEQNGCAIRSRMFASWVMMLLKNYLRGN